MLNRVFNIYRGKANEFPFCRKGKGSPSRRDSPLGNRRHETESVYAAAWNNHESGAHGVRVSQKENRNAGLWPGTRQPAVWKRAVPEAGAPDSPAFYLGPIFS